MTSAFLPWFQRPFRSGPLLTSGVTFLTSLLPPWSSTRARERALFPKHSGVRHHSVVLHSFPSMPLCSSCSPCLGRKHTAPASLTTVHLQGFTETSLLIGASPLVPTVGRFLLPAYLPGFSKPWCQYLFNWLLPPFYLKTYETRNHDCLNQHGIHCPQHNAHFKCPFSTSE